MSGNKMRALLIAFALIISGVLMAGSAYAVSLSAGAGAVSALGGSQPYGGRFIGAPIPCTCPTDLGKFIIQIGPPSPGFYIVDMKTVILKPYLYGMWIVPGAWHLGMKSIATPLSCKMVAPDSCVPAPFPITAKIEFAGTSLP